MKQQHSFTTPPGQLQSNPIQISNNSDQSFKNQQQYKTSHNVASLVMADSDSSVNLRDSLVAVPSQQQQQQQQQFQQQQQASPMVISKNKFAQIIKQSSQINPQHSTQQLSNMNSSHQNIGDENSNQNMIQTSQRAKESNQPVQRISQRNNRRSSRNSIKQNLIIMSNNNPGGGRGGQNDIAFSPVGGPEIAAQYTMRDRKNLPSPTNNIVNSQQQQQMQLTMIKNTIETYKIVPNSQKSNQSSNNQQQQPFMTNRQNQSNANQNTTISNSNNHNQSSSGGPGNVSVRNLQNLRSKRYNRVANNNQDNNQSVNQSLINPQLQSIQVDQTTAVRVPPIAGIQNGFYFNPNSASPMNNGNTGSNPGNQSVRYQQNLQNNANGQNSTKNNQNPHARVQSLDIQSIYKNQANLNNSTNVQIMPSITAVNSPKNGGVINQLNNSIEKINKGINESIKGSNKEIQLIQAYQQQKWKEQINQRKIRAAQQNARSIDVSNDPSNYAVKNEQFMSAKNSVFNQQIVFNRGERNSQQIAQKQPRIIGGGSLSSRLQQETIMHESTEADSQVSKLSIKFPLTSEQAYKTLLPYLWDYEKQEILEYEMIYFFNINERRKGLSSMLQSSLGNNQSALNNGSNLMQMGSGSSKMNNYGFDNENQEYNAIMHEHLGYRYEVIKKLGKGSFGIVLKCFDHKQKEFVAVKILKNKKRLYKQGLVEAKLVETLNKSDPEDKKNIIRKLDQFVFRNHLIITFEMLSINLYEFIKMNNFQGFSLNLIKRFAIQILISLFFMKEHNMVHCDMKPENILLRKLNKSGIKIIDFGSGCFENEKIYTYIQSRFYRAPEIVLGITYTTAIDMWSYGCILYELFVGYPLFPGEDEKEHMAMMMEVKGIPPRSVLARSSRRKVFFDDDYQPILVPNTRGKIRQPNTKLLQNIMNCPDKDFVDFIDRCLEWKVESRITPEQAFSHPFISKAVNELKGMRSGQSETQKQSTVQMQQTKQYLIQNSANNSLSESILPQINNKQQ